MQKFRAGSLVFHTELFARQVPSEVMAQAAVQKLLSFSARRAVARACRAILFGRSTQAGLLLDGSWRLLRTDKDARPTHCRAGLAVGRSGSVRTRANLESGDHLLWLLAAKCHTILCRSRADRAVWRES